MRQNRVFECVHVHRIHARKLFECPLFTIEQLQNHHPAYVFLQVGIDPGDRNPNAAIRITNSIAEKLGCKSDQRQGRKSDQRQLPVEAQHDSDNSSQHKNIFKD